MAVWCLYTGQTPATWRELTRTERSAFEDEVAAYHEKNKSKRRRK